MFGIVEDHIKGGQIEAAVQTLAPYPTEAEQHSAGWEPIRLVLSWPLLTPTAGHSQEQSYLWVLFCNYLNGNRAAVRQSADALIHLDPGGRYAKFAEALLSQMEREEPHAEE